MKIKSALKWAVVVCALGALTLAQPRAQATVPGALAAGDHHRWMGELFSRKPAAMDQSLARFIFPGTHDSGTYGITTDAACEGCRNSEKFTDVPDSCLAKLPDSLDSVCEILRLSMASYGALWSRAQSSSIGGQLNAGARYFDLRFFRATQEDAQRTEGRLQVGKFYIHHALAGPESTIILDEIAAFLAHPSNAQEILLLAFSKMEEGADSMDAATVELFFDQLRSRFGDKMARKQTDSCAAGTGTDCTATERFGHSTTLREFLNQGSQVMVSFSSSDAPDIWPAIPVSSSFGLDTDAGSGYPAPDDTFSPWRTDAELRRIYTEISEKRDAYGQDQMWGMGLEIGADDLGTDLWRGPVCENDIGDISGYCTAVDDDWDEFGSLADAANWINPKAIQALVSLRRDRVNIVTVDHYPQAFTEEVFKLNLGATRVHYKIDRVIANDALDDFTDPDYYPIWFYPLVPPLALQTGLQRYNQHQDNADLYPDWPAWKAYPNDWGTAEIMFGIMDADSGSDDDQSPINLPIPPFPRGNNPYYVIEQVPISACVQNSANCLRFDTPQFTDGAPFDDSSRVAFRRSACVWSWLPGDIVDAASLCGELLPQLNVRDVARVEGTGGVTTFDLVVTLTAPSLSTVTVMYSMTEGTADENDDYEKAKQTVTFSPGTTQQTVKVFVVGDANVESDESFTVTLFDPSGATIGDGEATVTIQDDDVVKLQIVGESRNEGDSGVTPFTFAVTLSAAGTEPVTVLYATGDGTAKAGSDYTAVPKTLLTFAPGETHKTVTIDVHGDFAVEGNEAFIVELSQASGATIAGGRATGVIVNDDEHPASLAAPEGQWGDEGATIAFDLGTLTDSRPAGPWTIEVNWGDGSSASYSVSAPGALTGSHAYGDNGFYSVTVSASDAGGVATNTVAFTATIANVNPTATLSNNGPLNEGGSATISFSGQADPSSVDAASFRYAFSCSNGSLASATYAASGFKAGTSCVFDDNGPRIVKARIIDKDGGFSEHTTIVVVNNVAPTATLTNNGPVNEGSAATITFSNPKDVSAADTTAGLHYAYSCTNASLAGATYATSASAATTSCTFADDGVHTVRGRIIDKDGGATEYTTAVTVRDVAPVVTAAPGQSGNEGSSVAFSLGTLADQVAESPWTIRVDWGDTHVESYPVTAAGPLTRSHAYADNGVYTVRVSATDKDQVASNAVTFAATIANVAPAITAIGSAINENGVATLSGAISDPGILDTFVVNVSWGDGGSSQHSFAAGTTVYAVTHQYLDDNPTGSPGDIAPVAVSVVDKDGGAGNSATGVRINNLDPAVSSLVLSDETGTTIGGALVVLSGLPIDLQAAFTDIGTIDTHTGVISWGDGTSGAGAVTESSGSGTLRATHTWSALGTVTVSVKVTDDDTGAGTRETTFAVVDAAGAVCTLAQQLTSMLGEPGLAPENATALTRLRGEIEGNIDGQAANGACDMFAKSNYVAALVKLDQAVRTIEGMIAGGSLTPAQTTLLRQVESRLILAAKWTYVTLMRVATSLQKRSDATALAQRADAATASRDYVSAIGQWLAAVRLLAPMS